MNHIHYQIDGNDELCLVVGKASADRRILIVAPLFDEMNRMRRVIVNAMRELASKGLYCALPDLPGCNESGANLAMQDLDTWRRAVTAAAAAVGATHVASIRGGALIDDGPSHLPHWRFAAVKGAAILKNMLRTRVAGDKEAGGAATVSGLLEMGRAAPIELAGNIIGPAMIASLENAQAASLANVCTIALGEGNDDIAGGALWLRAEPQDDPAMALSIAASIGRWAI
jgi:hypothetical protein